MCPLQIIHNIEPLSLTLHFVNACFIHHPPNVKITQSVISQKLVNQKKTKLNQVLYVYTFLQIYGSKFKIHIAAEIWELFQHLGNQYLKVQQITQKWHNQKSKIG